jgi:phosphodiesterase/alkaline phosphatase D-like protein
MSSLPISRRQLRLLANAMATVSSLVFVVLALTEGPPLRPEGPGLEQDIQYALVATGVAVTLLTFFAPAGGALMVFVGAMLGAAAAGSYSPQTALIVALLYAVPGALSLAVWSWPRHFVYKAVSVAFVAAVMFAGGNQAVARHEASFGAAHPQSDLQLASSDTVEWVWSGAVTSSSATVKARLATGVTGRLVVGLDDSFSEPVLKQEAGPSATDERMVAFEVQGLRPDTRYYYGVEVEGQIESARTGSFRTFPSGAASFTIAFGSCARTGSEGKVFETIRAADPLLYLITGDFFYGDILDDDREAFRDAYANQLMSPPQSSLYRRAPIAYVWDDHDFAGNNSTARSRAKPAAQAVYAESVPHYALPSGDGAIYQAFTIGRVRFVLSDMRSERNLEGHTILSQRQRDWLEQELLTASRTHGAVVWVSAVPWIGGSGDTWGGYPDERREIAEFIASNRIDNLVVVAGDAHMLAADDGSNSNYSSQPGLSFPVYQAGALDRPGSVKGGPYSEGTYPGAGQFGLLSFEDNGRNIKVSFSGRNWRNEEVVNHNVMFPGH